MNQPHTGVTYPRSFPRATGEYSPAVVIRRHPKPLPSPDTCAPSLPSHISPSRLICQQANWSQGYAVVVKRRKTADWATSSLDTEDTQVEPSSVRISTKQEDSHSFSDDGVPQSRQPKQQQSDMTTFSDNAQEDVMLKDGVKTDADSSYAGGNDILSCRPAREETSSSAECLSPLSMLTATTSREKLLCKVSPGIDALMKEETAKSWSFEIEQATEVQTCGSSRETSIEDTNMSMSPLSELHLPSSSSVRRSTRPFVPSQRLRESGVLKRRLSASDNGEQEKKQMRLKIKR